MPTPRNRARPAPPQDRPPTPAVSAARFPALQWTIEKAAEVSLARVLNLSAEQAATAAPELAADLRPTKTVAVQPNCTIWRASRRWHRLRAVVEQLGPTERKLRDVLGHADWKPPSKRPAVPVKPPPAPAAPPLVPVVRRPGVRPPAVAAVAPPVKPALPSVASTLSSAQLLALNAVVEDWRRGGTFPGLSKIATATGLPRAQAIAVADELERLGLNQPDAAGPAGREGRRIAELTTRVEQALLQVLRVLPVSARPETQVVIEQIAEHCFVLTVTADVNAGDMLIKAVTSAKGEGIVPIELGIQAVLRT